MLEHTGENAVDLQKQPVKAAADYAEIITPPPMLLRPSCAVCNPRSVARAVYLALLAAVPPHLVPFLTEPYSH